MPSGFKSDRRLFLNGDKSRVVEAADKGAAWLFVPVGRVFPEADAEAYGLECREGKVILPHAPAEPKAVKKLEDKALKRGGDKGARAAPRTVASARPPDIKKP